MIRYLLLIVSASFIVSCNNGPSKEKLVGIWKLSDMAYAGDSIIGTATFTKTNTVLIKTIINGKTVDSANGSYELSADNKLLTTKIDTSTLKFEIIKLTKDLLELKGTSKMTPIRYIRYKN